TIDPSGGPHASPDTGSTFKTGIIPWTNDPAHGNPPCFERDADNRQGYGPDTAPGMKIHVDVSSPYHGYTVETKIPFEDLPKAVEPKLMGLDMIVYHSDTTDLTGQWRTAWNAPQDGLQASPWVWGHASLAGYTPPRSLPRKAPPPFLPDTALLSVQSPQ